jgi:hypothetical protein
MKQARLLELDGIGNVLLGLPLLFASDLVSRFLGLPSTGATLYPAILGAVFVGVGVALLVERFEPSLGGLGLGGAISINLIFGVVLAGWLVLTDVELPARGRIVLSSLATILVAISLAEAYSLKAAERADRVGC